MLNYLVLKTWKACNMGMKLLILLLIFQLIAVFGFRGTPRAITSASCYFWSRNWSLPHVHGFHFFSHLLKKFTFSLTVYMYYSLNLFVGLL